MKVNRIRVLIGDKEVYNSTKEKKNMEAFEFKNMSAFKAAVDTGEIDERCLVLSSNSEEYFFGVYCEGGVRSIRIGTSKNKGIPIAELLELIFPEARVSAV